MCDCKSMLVPPSLLFFLHFVTPYLPPPPSAPPSPDGVALTIEEDNFTRMVGESLEVVISVDGQPTPSLQLTLDGNTIIGNTTTRTLTSTSFVISSIAVEDAGEYVLTATNVVNFMSASFQLIVKCE